MNLMNKIRKDYKEIQNLSVDVVANSTIKRRQIRHLNTDIREDPRISKLKVK